MSLAPYGTSAAAARASCRRTAIPAIRLGASKSAQEALPKEAAALIAELKGGTMKVMAASAAVIELGIKHKCGVERIAKLIGTTTETVLEYQKLKALIPAVQQLADQLRLQAAALIADAVPKEQFELAQAVLIGSVYRKHLASYIRRHHLRDGGSRLKKA